MAMSPIRPQDAAAPSPATQSVEKNAPTEDVSRFESSMSKPDEDTRADIREDARREAQRSDDVAGLFRRRAPADRERGGQGEREGGEDRGASDDDRRSIKPKAGPPTPDQSAAALLTGAALQAGVLQPAPVTEIMTPAARVASLANEIVDALQVTKNGPEGTEEVRIRLNSSALDGSEILLKNTGNRLEVTFVSATKDAELFLLNRQAELSATLGERLGKDVRVQVIDPSSDVSDSSPEAKSRNSGDGKEDQGRSRNRHLYDDGEDA